MLRSNNNYSNISTMFIIPLVGAFPATYAQALPKARNSRGGAARSIFPEDHRLWVCIYSILLEVTHIYQKIDLDLEILFPQASQQAQILM